MPIKFFKEADFERFERIWSLSWREQVVDFCNDLLEERGIVFCSGGGLEYEGQDPIEKLWSRKYPQSENRGATHRALLICVEPIEVDSAEKVLEDLANWEEWQHVRERGKPSLLEIQERARKLTQNKGGGK